jgi:peptide/nickel transport system permease protein
MEIVLERLPNTVMLIVAGLGLAILLSLPLGALAALKPGGVADRATVFVGLVGLSVPQFWLGLLLILVFAVDLKVLPTSGFGTPAHLVLPAITLAIPSLARLVMLVRSSIIDELNQQYVRAARAKGLRFHRVLFAHAARNTLVPFLTLAGWETISALAGYTVVVETVFAWPGIGLYAVNALITSDYAPVQGFVLTMAVLYVALNLLIDVLYGLVDPRVRLG